MHQMRRPNPSRHSPIPLLVYLTGSGILMFALASRVAMQWLRYGYGLQNYLWKGDLFYQGLRRSLERRQISASDCSGKIPKAPS